MKCRCPERPKPYTHTLVAQRPKTNPTEQANGQIDWGDDDNWTVVGRIRARFETKGGMETARTETEAYQQVQAVGRTMIFTPASGITRSMDPTWRLVLGTRKFNVTACWLVNEFGHEYQIDATERR
jgi:hypothetical protein